MRRTAIIAGLSILLAGWYIVLTCVHPAPIGDEQYYRPGIAALLRGQGGVTQGFSPTPTYFWLLTGVASLLGDSVWVLRGVSLAAGVIGLVAYQRAVAARYPADRGARAACLALHPLLVPFWALVYTDVPSLAAILLTLNWHVRGRHVLAAAGALAATALRQSNAVWLVFFAVLAAVEWRQTIPNGERPMANSGKRHAASRPPWTWRYWLSSLRPVLWPYLVAAGLLVVMVAGGLLRVLPEPIVGPRANPAHFYGLSLAAAVLWVPVWLPHLRRIWPRTVTPRLLRPWFWAAVVGAVGVLALAFTNPHPWNTDLAFLRNWPLWAMTHWVPARFAAAGLLVVVLPPLVAAMWQNENRRTLGLLWLFALLFLLPHYMVDPRYYIIPLVLADFFMPQAVVHRGALCTWYVLLTAGVAAFVLGSPGGGMW